MTCNLERFFKVLNSLHQNNNSINKTNVGIKGRDIYQRLMQVTFLFFRTLVVRIAF